MGLLRLIRILGCECAYMAHNLTKMRNQRGNSETQCEGERRRDHSLLIPLETAIFYNGAAQRDWQNLQKSLILSIQEIFRSARPLRIDKIFFRSIFSIGTLWGSFFGEIGGVIFEQRVPLITHCF